MSFTDDDLKRLKDNLEAPSPHMNWVQNHVVRSLLARLEAAEAVIAQHDLYETEDEMKAWLRAAGKEKGE